MKNTSEEWPKEYITDLARLGMREAQVEFQKATKQKSKELPKDAPSHLYLKANGRLRDLLQLANEGDREAASYLLSVLTKNVQHFLNLCLQKPTLVRQIWEPSQPWPLLHTQLRGTEKGLTVPGDHALRKLGVIPGRRGFSKKTITTAVAKQLYCLMKFYRRPLSGEGGEALRPLQIKPAVGGDVAEGDIDVTINLNETVSSAWTLGHLARDLAHAEQIKRIRALAPLQSTNWREWWKEAEQIFEERWGEEFQDHPDFLNWPAPDTYKNKKTPRGKPQKTRGRKRSDIKGAIKEAFRSLANRLQVPVPETPGEKPHS
jgi:hypothetical protein